MGLSADLAQYAAELETEFGLPGGFLSGQAMAESSGDPNATNGDATGLMQFMPATAAQYNVDSTDPYSSLYGAAEYDSALHAKTGSWVSTLADYGTTAGDALQTNTAAQAVNAIALAADSGNPITAVSNALGQSPQNYVNSKVNPNNGAPSGVFSQFAGWLKNEKYNAAAVVIGIGFVVGGAIKMMGGEETLSLLA